LSHVNTLFRIVNEPLQEFKSKRTGKMLKKRNTNVRTFESYTFCLNSRVMVYYKLTSK